MTTLAPQIRIDDVQSSGVGGSRPPIRFKTKDGELTRILLTEEWYDPLKQIYDYFRWASAGISIKESSINLGAASGLFGYFVIEFGGLGWVFTFSIFALLKRAAEHSISLQKFAYKKVGIPATMGRPLPGTLGGKRPYTLGRSLQIQELPEE